MLIEMIGNIPRPVRLVGTAAAILFGGLFTLSLASSTTIRALQIASEAKRKKYTSPCGVCQGKGFYYCKLCKGSCTIHWSPLYDPIAINPCLCPTCEGNGATINLWRIFKDICHCLAELVAYLSPFECPSGGLA